MARPRKVITSSAVAAVYAAVLAGESRGSAAEAAGVSRSLLFGWLAEGRELVASGRPPVSRHESLLRFLVVDVDRADRRVAKALASAKPALVAAAARRQIG